MYLVTSFFYLTLGAVLASPPVEVPKLDQVVFESGYGEDEHPTSDAGKRTGTVGKGDVWVQNAGIIYRGVGNVEGASGVPVSGATWTAVRSTSGVHPAAVQGSYSAESAVISPSGTTPTPDTGGIPIHAVAIETSDQQYGVIERPETGPSEQGSENRWIGITETATIEHVESSYVKQHEEYHGSSFSEATGTGMEGKLPRFIETPGSGSYGQGIRDGYSGIPETEIKTVEPVGGGFVDPTKEISEKSSGDTVTTGFPTHVVSSIRSPGYAGRGIRHGLTEIPVNVGEGHPSASFHDRIRAAIRNHAARFHGIHGTGYPGIGVGHRSTGITETKADEQVGLGFGRQVHHGSPLGGPVGTGIYQHGGHLGWHGAGFRGRGIRHGLAGSVGTETIADVDRGVVTEPGIRRHGSGFIGGSGIGYTGPRIGPGLTRYNTRQQDGHSFFYPVVETGTGIQRDGFIGGPEKGPPGIGRRHELTGSVPVDRSFVKPGEEYPVEAIETGIRRKRDSFIRWPEVGWMGIPWVRTEGQKNLPLPSSSYGIPVKGADRDVGSRLPGLGGNPGTWAGSIGIPKIGTGFEKTTESFNPETAIAIPGTGSSKDGGTLGENNGDKSAEHSNSGSQGGKGAGGEGGGGDVFGMVKDTMGGPLEGGPEEAVGSVAEEAGTGPSGRWEVGYGFPGRGFAPRFPVPIPQKLPSFDFAQNTGRFIPRLPVGKFGLWEG